MTLTFDWLLEEAYLFGEGVLPELRRRGVWVPPGEARELELERAGHGVVSMAGN
jgi:hypothetical protein